MKGCSHGIPKLELAPLFTCLCFTAALPFLATLNDDVDIQLVSEDTAVDHAYYKELEKLSIKSLTMAVYITDQV